MTEKEICPGCGRRCDLSNPHCERGRAYAVTGGLPEGEHRQSRPREEHRQTKPRAEHRMHRADKDMNERLILSLRDVSQIMRMQYEGKASQKRILMILRASGPMTQKELTERLGIQPGSASEILSKLEHAGLIVRTPNETDRRTTDVLLTDAGEALALEAARQRQRRHEEMFSCLTPEEQRTLLALLDKLRTDWDGRFAKPTARGSHEAHGGRGGRRHGGQPRHRE